MVLCRLIHGSKLVLRTATGLQLTCRSLHECHNNLKFCVVGSGPGGFYTAQNLIKYLPSAEVDIYEKLPVPYGLIRYGVAPDHQDVKNTAKSFATTAMTERCFFWGNVTVGKDVSFQELKDCYHGIILSYGADEDRPLQIPGEELKNVFSARKFVGWYNGLPEYVDLQPNLDVETVVVIGQGNVALDCARILLLPLEQLQKTDVARPALDILRKSQVRRVILVGRRGPFQVAFTTKEIRDLTKLQSTRAVLHRHDFEGLSDELANCPRHRKRMTELLIKTALESDTEKMPDKKEWELRFLLSPLEIVSDGSSGKVGCVSFNKNQLQGSGETAKAIPTGETEKIQCGLVIKSVGYRSIQVDPDIPFDQKQGIVPNQDGCVSAEMGVYCSGWVKTGPVGVIPSTKVSSEQTVQTILRDYAKVGSAVVPKPGRKHVLELLKNRGVRAVTFQDWLKIDEWERSQGQKVGKPREKVLTVDEMLSISGKL